MQNGKWDDAEAAKWQIQFNIYLDRFELLTLPCKITLRNGAACVALEKSVATQPNSNGI